MSLSRRSDYTKTIWLVLAVACWLLPGCRSSPSYSDIKVDKSGALVNSNTARPETQPPIESQPQNETQPLIDPASSPGSLPDPLATPEASATPTSAPPSFVDPKTGQIKSLPLFPGAKVRGLRYGPINGLNQVTLQAVTRAPMDKVTAFYDQVVKQNGWTVDDNSRGADTYTWMLSKGQNDRAAIRIDRDRLGRTDISLARTN